MQTCRTSSTTAHGSPGSCSVRPETLRPKEREIASQKRVSSVYHADRLNPDSNESSGLEFRLARRSQWKDFGESGKQKGATSKKHEKRGPPNAHTASLMTNHRKQRPLIFLVVSGKGPLGVRPRSARFPRVGARHHREQRHCRKWT